jgi:hypothetical protein
MIPTTDPYTAADIFVSCGWSLEFATDPDSDDRMAVMSLADNTVMLGVAVPPFVEPEALPHLGAGTAFHCSVPAADLERIHDAHQAQQPTPLETQPWGERGFQVTVCNFRFMFVESTS